ncbi:hypothetical protein NEMBOFW57_005065 [Staphylotrichum longicolle]|uniref:DNA-directed RNA polymerase III RPC4 n=1 Tax=Staphylotrichum longicolle TaxID=669026 RepID=A0AAD4HVR6_9PEZI|nr:hypothetical protein NEMBOFW57_005065 [Staphylotrichum longicolle]
MTVSSESTPEVVAAPTSSRLPSSTPTPAASSRGSTAKFRPKGVRRSETERARIAEEQQKIQDQRNAEEARRLARLNRGRGRGRGYAYASGSGSGSGFVKGEGEGKEAGPYGSSGIIDNSRINADMLYNYVEISDEEDRASVTSTKKKRRPIMPMGIRRVEHQEEGVTMTTAAEIEAQEKAGGVEEESDEEGLFVGGPAEIEGSETPKEEGVSEATQARTIKTEEGEGGAMDLDEIPEGIKAPESPELKKKVPVSEQKPKKKAAVPKDSEAEIITEDLHRMVELFTLGGDDTIAEDGAANNAALEGHMFLFQFPPVLPPLRAAPRDGTSTNPIPIKPEPDDDVVMLNQPAVNIDLTQDADKKVKKEGDGEEAEGRDDEEDEDELKEGGFIGNLIVRKSGKVELSWGGQKLELMPGTQTNFLSTAVLIEQADVKPNDASQMAGVAYGMGKIQGSFALAPVWGDEEDWDVDPAELKV